MRQRDLVAAAATVTAVGLAEELHFSYSSNILVHISLWPKSCHAHAHRSIPSIPSSRSIDALPATQLPIPAPDRRQNSVPHDIVVIIIT